MPPPPSPAPPVRRHWILAAYTAVVLALTLLPVPDVATGLLPPWSDKVVHFLLFAALAALVCWDRFAAGRPRPLGVIGPVAVLAGLIELAQGPLPERSGDVWDFVLGSIGAALGYGATMVAARRLGAL